MSESLDHQIGRISGRMDALDANLKGLEQRIEFRLNTLDANVKIIHDRVTSAGGSWKALVWLGGAITALAAVLSATFHWITGR